MWRDKEWKYGSEYDDPESAAAYEFGADDILIALEPLIREIAPSSKLIDVLYPKEE